MNKKAKNEEKEKLRDYCKERRGERGDREGENDEERFEEEAGGEEEEEEE